MAILAAAAVPHPPIILPEVGQGEEKKIEATTRAYHEVMARAAALKPETVVIISPHATIYGDYFHISPGESGSGDMGQFRAPQVKFDVTYDEEFVQVLAGICEQQNVPAGTLGARQPRLDHGTMIPLYFLREHLHLEKLQFVRIGFSGLAAQEHYRFGQCIARAAEQLGRRVLLIASGDLSHKLKKDGPYGLAAEGPLFDQLATQSLGRADYLSLMEVKPELAEAAAECGLRSFWIMAGALDRRAVKGELLSYEGTFGVGYGVAWELPEGEDESRNLGEQYEQIRRQAMEKTRAGEDALVRLARASLEYYVMHHETLPLPEGLPVELLQQRSGAFVSLKKDGKLRGCIGTFLPTRDNLALEIIYNAISAGTRDPRFDQVGAEELPDIVYDVDVLTEPEPIDSPKKLDVRRYGVIVQCGERRGLLLPDLAGVDTVEQQIDIARRKGNIGQKEPVQLYRFEVARHT